MVAKEQKLILNCLLSLFLLHLYSVDMIAVRIGIANPLELTVL